MTPLTDQDLQPTSARALLDDAKKALLSTLPREWFVSTLTKSSRSIAGFDAELTIESPGAFRCAFDIELKISPKRRDLAKLFELINAEPETPLKKLLIARYLSPSIRDELQQKKISFIDSTGNIFIQSAEPAIFVRRDGAQADPWRGPGRPVGSLRGLPAARLVRALADFEPPYTTPQLAKMSGASPGATYRLMDFLDQEGLIERTKSLITSNRWKDLLRRWSQETETLSPSTTGTGFIEPRGIQEVRRKLRTASDTEYAITGSMAAETYYSFAEVRLVTLYTDSPLQMAEALGWRKVSSGANLIIAAPRTPVVFDRAVTADGLRRVSPSQAVADLLNGPGRQPAEGEALIEWMGAHEDEWRR